MNPLIPVALVLLSVAVLALMVFVYRLLGTLEEEREAALFRAKENEYLIGQTQALADENDKYRLWVAEHMTTRRIRKPKPGAASPADAEAEASEPAPLAEAEA